MAMIEEYANVRSMFFKVYYYYAFLKCEFEIRETHGYDVIVFKEWTFIHFPARSP